MHRAALSRRFFFYNVRYLQDRCMKQDCCSSTENFIKRTESMRSVWREQWSGVDTIMVPDILLNLDVTCLFKAQQKPEEPGMQPGL